MPGSAPPRMPQQTPIVIAISDSGRSAIERPSAKFSSTRPSLCLGQEVHEIEQAAGQWDAEQPAEEQVQHQGYPERAAGDREGVAHPQHEEENDHVEQRADEVAESLQQQDVGN